MPDFAIVLPGASLPEFDVIAVLGALLRLGIVILAFAMLLKVIAGIFLVLTHGGNEERKAAAHKTVRDGAMAFAAMLVLAAVVPMATTALSGLASRYLS